MKSRARVPGSRSPCGLPMVATRREPGQSLGMMLGPVLATTAVAAGQVAWLGYAVLFAALGVGGWVLSRRAAAVTG